MQTGAMIGITVLAGLVACAPAGPLPTVPDRSCPSGERYVRPTLWGDAADAGRVQSDPDLCVRKPRPPDQP